MEAKGRQELYEKQSPDVLRALRELAIVESTESSNRIEGVEVEPGCRRPAGQYLKGVGKNRVFRVKLLLAVLGARRRPGTVVVPWEVPVSECYC